MIKKKGFFSELIAYQLKYGPKLWYMVGFATLCLLLGIGDIGAVALFGAFAYIWWHFVIKHICRFFYALFVDGDKAHPWPNWLQ